MTPKHDLYELVQSLTNSEINSFRKEITKRKGRHVYLMLFDYLLEMPAYDEEVLKDHFKGEKTLNNFSIAKSNLYEKVLNVLCSMPHHQNLETRFDQFRQQISILVKKSLHKQALARVKKSIRIAEKLESFRKLQDLYEIQREIGRNFLNPRNYVDLHNEIRARETWLREVNNNLHRYKELFETATIAPYFRRQVRNTMINGILSHPLIQDESECRSIAARIYFYRVWNYLYNIQKKESGWQYFSQKIIEIFEENKHLLADPGNFLTYANTVYDFGLKSIFIGDFDDAETATLKLEGIRKDLKSGEGEALIFCSYWKLRLILHQKRLELDGGLEAMKSVKSGIRRFREKISKQDEMELNYLVAVFLLSLDRSSEAISWIMTLRNEKVTSTRPDLHFYSWLLFLIAHFNLGHFDVLEQQLPGTERYLKDRKALGPLEKRSLTFFKKFIRAAEPSQIRTLLTDFHTETETILQNERYASLYEHFDMLAWIRSRQKGVPMQHELDPKIG